MPERFSKTVKEVRRQLEMSQEDLARELGVSFATINRWENDKTVPSRLALKQFDAFYKEMRKKGFLKFPI